MPYPRYQGNNGNNSRDDRRGGFNQNQSMNVSPWGSNNSNFNQGYGPSTGPGALLPTPGNRGMGSPAVDPMTLVGNLMGAMAQQNNPLATLANQLALAQAMQNKAGNMSGGGDMGPNRGGGVDLRRDMDRGRSRPDMGRRNRDRSPIARRSSMGARRSRSPRDKRRSNGGSGRGGGRDRSREKRAEHEIYIGNYPVRFREADVRKLFEENGITVSTIRLKHDGLKVFAFAETDSLEMIEKAKNAMEGKEINGRMLRVRSSKDKSEREAEQRAKNSKKEAEDTRKRSRGTEREVGRDDIKKYLVAAFIDFMDREVEAAGEEAPGEYKGLMDAAKKALAAAYSLPEDESFKVNKDLEDIFLGSVRREIKLPELPKADLKKEDMETTSNCDGKDKDADDDGNWKRRKVAKDDEDEDDALGKEDESEEISINEQDNEENDEEIEDLGSDREEEEADADTTSPPDSEKEKDDAKEKIVEEVEDKQEITEGGEEDEEAQVDDSEEKVVSSPPSKAPTRSSRSSRK